MEDGRKKTRNLNCFYSIFANKCNSHGHFKYIKNIKLYLEILFWCNHFVFTQKMLCIAILNLKTLLHHFSKQMQAKRLFFYGKICIKACLEIEKTQAVSYSHPKKCIFSIEIEISATVIRIEGVNT